MAAMFTEGFTFLTIKRLLRSASLLKRYGTSKKIANFMRAEIAYRRREIDPAHMPYILRVDPSTACTLACPYCLRTIREPLPPAALGFDVFAAAFAPFAEYLFLVPFQMFGEPTANPALPEMIAHVEAAGVASYVSTNLQQIDRAGIDRIMRSGLSLLTVCLDAATPETYRRMKPGGDYERLRENLQIFIEVKRRLPHPPAVGLQVLVTAHNENELPAIRALAGKLGADYLDCKPTMFLPDDSWHPRDVRYRPTLNKKTVCAMPWHSLTLLSNGRFFPCCNHPGAFDLGDGGGDPIMNVWRGAALRDIRRGLVGDNLEPLCRGCEIRLLPRF